MTAEANDRGAAQRDAMEFADDRDHLAILPLAAMPLKTPALKQARMIKNVHLETVIEFFSGRGSGSGQMDVADIGGLFDWPRDSSHPDFGLLLKLARLPSYDVYSLRRSLREIGVAVDDVSALRLSDAMAAELTTYMTRFTRPLIRQVYGAEVDVDDFGQLLELFRHPDKQKALDSLNRMAKQLGIGVTDVPRFLEDFGDVFLSLSYYRRCLDSIEPMLEDLVDSLDDLRENWQLRQDPNLMNTCDEVESVFNNLSAQITGRLESFDRGVEEMWDDLSAERFRGFQSLIESYHVTIGGVLCSLWVKLHAWHVLFPKRGVGGPVRRSEFLMSELRQGLDRIRKIEDTAPMMSRMEERSGG
jgi:hypothetical protein